MCVTIIQCLSSLRISILFPDYRVLGNLEPSWDAGTDAGISEHSDECEIAEASVLLYTNSRTQRVPLGPEQHKYVTAPTLIIHVSRVSRILLS